MGDGFTEDGYSINKHAFVWLLKSDKGDDIKPQVFINRRGKGMSVHQSGYWLKDNICFVASPAVFSFNRL